MKVKLEKPLRLTATLRPADFPLGSAQSRAAVRMHLLKIKKAQSRFTFVLHVPRPHQDRNRYHFTPWAGTPRTGFIRTVFAPSEWLNPGDPVPVCVDCGKPYRKGQEALGKISYLGDCWEVHDPERGNR
jgi:hypothetical protein